MMTPRYVTYCFDITLVGDRQYYTVVGRLPRAIMRGYLRHVVTAIMAGRTARLWRAPRVPPGLPRRDIIVTVECHDIGGDIRYV